MSSPTSGRSSDLSGSPRYSHSSKPSPFPQSDIPQRPGSNGRYGARHNSTASFITPIGRMLDSSLQGGNTIAEAGNNGKLYI